MKNYFYVKKVGGGLDFENGKITLPLSVLMEEFGKSHRRHYVVIAVFDDGVAIFDLNRERIITNEINGNFSMPVKDADFYEKYS